MIDIENNFFYKETLSQASNTDERYKRFLELAEENLDKKKEFIELIYWFRDSAYSKASGGGPQWASNEIIEQYKSDPFRFIHEFIQNIDDCIYEKGSNPSLTICTTEDIISFEYNEKGFGIDDIHSLTCFGDSSKTKGIITENKEGIFSNAKTGEKGIGFKSVFGIAKKVIIESGGYSFYLTKEKSIVPIWFETENPIDTGTRITLTELEENLKPNEIIERLKERYLSNEIEDVLSKNILLFTKKLREIKILNNDGEKTFLRKDGKCTFNKKKLFDNTINQLDGIEHKGEFYESVNLDVNLNMNGNLLTCKKIVKTILLEADIVKKRFYDESLQQTRNISIVAELSREAMGKLYTTLPLSEHSLGLPMAIDAPFKLNTNRDEIDYNNAVDWNNEISKELFGNDGLLYTMFESIKGNENVDITKFLNGQELFKSSENNKENVSIINLKEIVSGYKIFEKYIQQGNNSETDIDKWISLNELCILDEFGYEFPDPIKLVECIDTKGKVLADEKYLDKLNKKHSLVWKEKRFVEVVNSYIDKTMERKQNGDFFSNQTCNFIKGELYSFIEEKFQSLKEQELKKLKIFRYHLHDEKDKGIITGVEDNIHWICQEERLENKSSFDKYRLLQTSYFDKDKHSNLISLLECKEFDEIFSIDNLKKMANDATDLDKCKKLIKVMLYYDIKPRNIPFLKNCCLNEKYDNENFNNKENVFRINNVLQEISQDDINDIEKITQKRIHEVVDFIINCGLRRNKDLFIEKEDYIELEEKTKELLKKCQDESVIKLIEENFSEEFENKKSLKIEYNSDIPLKVSKYIIKENLLNGDVLKNYCKAYCKAYCDDNDKNDYKNKNEILFLVLNNLESNDIVECKNKLKETTIKMSLEEVLVLNNLESNDIDECLNKRTNVVNEVMKKHMLGNLEIEGGFQEYKNDVIEQAAELLSIEKEGNVPSLKNIFGIEKFVTVELSEIPFLYDSKKAILSTENEENSLSEFANYVITAKSGKKASFKNYLNFINEKNELKQAVIDEGCSAEKYVEKLSAFRKLQSRISDVKSTIDHINEAKSNPEQFVLYELLQNINDTKRADGSLCDVNFKIDDSKNTMTISYNEIGFKPSDVYSITSLGNSTKHDSEEGEKGIGFKTIFMVFDKVEIHSNGFHFSLTKNCPIIPEWCNTIPEYSSGRTTMRFTLANDKSFDIIEQQLGAEKTFLFLKNINSWTINEKPSVLLSDVKKNYYQYNCSLSKILNESDFDILKKRKKWSDKENRDLNRIIEELSIDIYIPKEIKNTNKNGGIYSKLYTTQEFNAPILINAPFELTTGRDKLLDGEYNKFIKEKVFKKNNCCFKLAMEKFAKEDEVNILKYMPQAKGEYVSNDMLRNIEFIPVYDRNELVSLRKSFTVTELLYNLIEIDKKQERNNKQLYSKLYTFLKNKYFSEDNYSIIKISDINFNDVNQYAISLGEPEEWFPRGNKLDKLVDLFQELYTEKDIVFDKSNPTHSFLKEHLWREKNDCQGDYYKLPIFPYKINENETKLGCFNGENWYIADNNKRVSADKYKILDNLLLSEEWFNGGQISEFTKSVIINQYLIEMSNEEDYTQAWWENAKALYDIWDGEGDNFHSATKKIHKDKMHFRKEYLDEELKKELLKLKIVEDFMISKPYEFIFKDKSNSLTFDKFIKSLGVPCEFTWLEGDKFNAWTIELLKKVKGYSNKNEKQKFYRLVDTLIFDKLCSSNDFKNTFSNTGIEGFDIGNMPVLSDDDGRYYCPNECFFYNVTDKAMENKDFRFRILDKKYWNNKGYLDSLKANDFKESIPDNLFFNSETYDRKYPVEFWKWVWKNSDNTKLTEELFSMLVEGLTGKGDNSYGKRVKDAEKFLMEIIKKDNSVVENNKDAKICLSENTVEDYLDVLEKVYDKVIFKLEPTQTTLSVPQDVICEITNEIRFAEKKAEIEEWLNNIYVVSKKSEQLLYARMKNKDDVNLLVLSKQANEKEYRENISQFLEEIYKLKLDKRVYTMTAIDNSQYTKTIHCTQKIFDDMLSEENLLKSELQGEDKKRMLMEPLVYKGSFLQGYAKTCPFCGKIVVTQLSSMRIKTVRVNNVALDFLCCSTCSDIFEYCDGQPKVSISNNGERFILNENEENGELIGKIKNINSDIELMFYMEPEYLDRPYTIIFKPRAAHRYLIIKNLQGK